MVVDGRRVAAVDAAVQIQHPDRHLHHRRKVSNPGPTAKCKAADDHDVRMSAGAVIAVCCWQHRAAIEAYNFDVHSQQVLPTRQTHAMYGRFLTEMHSMLDFAATPAAGHTLSSPRACPPPGCGYALNPSTHLQHVSERHDVHLVRLLAHRLHTLPPELLHAQLLDADALQQQFCFCDLSFTECQMPSHLTLLTALLQSLAPSGEHNSLPAVAALLRLLLFGKVQLSRPSGQLYEQRHPLQTGDSCSGDVLGCRV